MSTLVDPSELIDRNEAAKLAGLSLAGFKLARSEGRTPEPIVIAGRPYWRRPEIEAWAAERAARRSQ
jgi:predicted DNA-binding transcriptional regulator AlpA